MPSVDERVRRTPWSCDATVTGRCRSTPAGPRRGRAESLSVVLATLAASVPAAAQCHYTAELIEPQTCGVHHQLLTVEDINARGRACGHVTSCDFDQVYGIVQGASDEVELLDFGKIPFDRVFARSIADDGTIVGQFEHDELVGGLASQAFVHDGRTPMLLPVPEGGNFGRAESISRDGTVVVGYWGHSVTGEPNAHAFAWTSDGLADLNAALGDPWVSWGHAIDPGPARVVVGTLIHHGTTVRTAYRLDLETKAFVELPVEGSIRTNAWATAGGWVTGAARIETGEGMTIDRAVRWRPDGQPELLEPHSAVGTSIGWDVTPAGTVLGSSVPEDGSSRPTLWPAGRTQGVELAPYVSGVPGLHLTRGVSISGGVIACQGIHLGRSVGVRLTPVDPPVGDLTGDCVVGATDLQSMLAAWGTDAAHADLDADGVVAVGDLLMLLANWSG